MFKIGCALYYSMAELGATDLEHLYRIYSIPTHDKHQWLLLQFIVLLMMDAKGVRNMQSILVAVNKHNTARVASCWFIIYYRLVMHGNSNIKLPLNKCTIKSFSTSTWKLKLQGQHLYAIQQDHMAPYSSFLRCYTMLTGQQLPKFQRNIVSPSTRSTLKLEVLHSSDTSVFIGQQGVTSYISLDIRTSNLLLY